jgi:hypothetical protein
MSSSLLGVSACHFTVPIRVIIAELDSQVMGFTTWKVYHISPCDNAKFVKAYGCVKLTWALLNVFLIKICVLRHSQCHLFVTYLILTENIYSQSSWSFYREIRPLLTL